MGLGPYKPAGCVLLVGLDGCEVRLCGPSAFVRPRVPCVPCVSRLPPPRCLFTALGMSKCSVRTSVSVRRRALSMLLGHGVLGHEPLSVCEVA